MYFFLPPECIINFAYRASAGISVGREAREGESDRPLSEPSYDVMASGPSRGPVRPMLDMLGHEKRHNLRGTIRGMLSTDWVEDRTDQAFHHGGVARKSRGRLQAVSPRSHTANVEDTGRLTVLYPRSAASSCFKAGTISNRSPTIP